MRRRLHTSLLSFVAVCALASVAARAQDAAQSSAQPKAQPAAKRRAPAKRPIPRKKTADEAGAAEATPRKSSGDADAAASQSPATTDAAPSQTPASSSEAPKDKGEATKSKDDATKSESEAEKPDAASQAKPDAAAQSKSDAVSQSKSDAATPAKPDASSKSAKPEAAKGRKKAADDQPARAFDPAKAAELKSKLDEIQKLAAWERIAELRDFLELDLPDDLADTATERLISAEAAYGDERLKAGDTARGLSLFRDALADSDEDISDDLYYEVVSQLPANLVLRGQLDAAFELARGVEKIARGDARRLLALAAFYVSTEQPEEAARLASAALKLRPNLAAAHQALAAADRLALKLDDTVAEYARAAELDPKSTAARQSLADMKRATGKPDEALAIYRDLLASDPQDRAARDGVVLALFDTGKRAEAEHELEAALKDDPRDVQLLSGAAYWYAAHGEPKRAFGLAAQVVQIAPHQPWAQVVLSRALIANGMPFEAERAVRFLRNFAHFPTLDYELANTLAAEGFYAEAAEELTRSFSLKGDEIETRLAGRVPATATSFIELLAPERRASLFEPDAADTPENARQLKGLLALHTALRATDTDEQRAAAEGPAAQAARDFASGDDAARAFRQLYAANRLLRRNVASATALELVNAARRGVQDAISTPQATAAVTADELRSTRAAALAQGTTPDIPDVPRDVLDRLMRGRIEEFTGWALLNQGRAKESVAPLRQAVGVMPENSLYWREALWRLGNAYLASGEPQQALNSYVKSFDQENPDEARFAVIQALYRKLNGNLDGLEVLFGLAPERASSADSPTRTPQQTAPNNAPPWAAGTSKSLPKNNEAATSDPTKIDTTSDPTKVETKSDAAKRDDAGEKGDEPKRAETKNTEAKSAEMRSAETKGAETKSAESAQPPASSDAGAQANAAPTPQPSPDAPPASGATTPNTPGDSNRPASARRAGECSLALDSEAVSLRAGASASFTVSLEGGDPSKITATTPNWSDILILREPSGGDATAVKFTIISISKSPGDYAVTIKSPCGAKKITVSVK